MTTISHPTTDTGQDHKSIFFLPKISASLPTIAQPMMAPQLMQLTEIDKCKKCVIREIKILPPNYNMTHLLAHFLKVPSQNL